MPPYFHLFKLEHDQLREVKIRVAQMIRVVLAFWRRFVVDSHGVMTIEGLSLIALITIAS